MEERRQQGRRSTELQLEVVDANSGERLGRIVDLSKDGFMLFCESKLACDSVWECRLIPLSPIEGIQEVRLGADCLWTRPGADGRHYWAGFHIIDLAESQAAQLEILLRHI